jgi:hypothetical protein
LDGKSSSKKSKKEEPTPFVVEEEPAPEPEPEPQAEEEREAPKADGWGFWGASLKSSKKAAPPPPKEIASDGWANEGASAFATADSEMPEVSFATSAADDAGDAFAPPKSMKSSKSSKIQERIKALQPEPEPVKAPKDLKKSSKSAYLPEVDLLADPEPMADFSPIEEKKSSSSKDKDKKSKSSSSKKDKKESSPSPIVQAPTPVPGGFPDDDYFPAQQQEMPPPPPPPVHAPAAPPKKSSSSKDKKSSKTSSSKYSSKRDTPPPAPVDDLLDMNDVPMPTPPQEKTEKPRSKDKEHRSSKEKDESRSAKKERPKVVRDQGSQSWGFWGAQAPAPKSSSKSKPSSPVKERPATLSRSKSARKPADRDHMEKGSKSSGSEEGKGRPSTSRGMSFSGMFGKASAPPPPSRSKSTRQSSSRDVPRPSRRHSTAIDDYGMVSPPPDEPGEKNVAAKAAKVMGFTGRSGTLKEKRARRVPDPYAIDSDDMVVVDPPNAEEPPRDRRDHKVRRNKRDSAYMSGALGNEDAVMVDTPRDEMRVTSGPDDIAFVDRPPPMRRTESIKKSGIIGGILGAFAGKPNMERRQSRAHESDYDAARRKRSSAYEDDPSKRLRREDRRLHRSQRSADGEGYPDGGMTDAEDPAAREARRAERRERRERYLAEDPERAARHEARRAERDRPAQEDDERRREERRARHAEREARRLDNDRLAQEEEAKNEERRERRRQRDQMRMDDDVARLKAERRRSHAPEDDEARRARHEERRMRHSMAEASGDKERPRHSRRRSERPAPVEGYFDRRNGEHAGDGAPDVADADGAPFMHVKTGKDKTASWVHSISDAPPPPIEATIIDAPVHYATDYAPDEDATAREMRHSRRKASHRHRDLDGYSTEDPELRRRRQDGAVRGRGMGGVVNSMGYDSMMQEGVRTFDGRPAGLQRGESKKGSSWLKRVTGL